MDAIVRRRHERLRDAATRAVAVLGSALFPHVCAACGEEGEVLCKEHRNDVLRPMRGVFVCPGCGSASAGGRACGGAGCVTSLDAAVAMAPYSGALAGTLLRWWKYEGVGEARKELLRAVRTHIAARGPFYDLLLRDSVLVPVPAGPIKKVIRGFDQAEVLARAVAVGSGRPVVCGLLCRSVRLRRQAELHDADARWRNASGSFMVAEGMRVPASVTLVDDVTTSGATLEACARALKDAGAVEVQALTVLRG